MSPYSCIPHPDLPPHLPPMVFLEKFNIGLFGPSDVSLLSSCFKTNSGWPAKSSKESCRASLFGLRIINRASLQFHLLDFSSFVDENLSKSFFLCSKWNNSCFPSSKYIWKCGKWLNIVRNGREISVWTRPSGNQQLCVRCHVQKATFKLDSQQTGPPFLLTRPLVLSDHTALSLSLSLSRSFSVYPSRTF